MHHASHASQGASHASHRFNVKKKTNMEYLITLLTEREGRCFEVVEVLRYSPVRIELA